MKLLRLWTNCLSVVFTRGSMSDHRRTDTQRGYSNRQDPGWHIWLSDLANMVKAFMGSNYLSIAYAFRQSGLVMGLVGLGIIAIVTDHCCGLIVKCKYQVIQKILSEHTAQAPSLPTKKSQEESLNPFGSIEDDNAIISKRMTQSLTYGDIGKFTFGTCGLFIVNACLVFTQFGFCVAYFIFVGNTLHSLFGSSTTNMTTSEINKVNIVSSAALVSNSIYDSLSRDDSLKNNSLLPELVELADFQKGGILKVSVGNTTTVSDAPDLRLLVISPLPLFIVFALLRKVRHLGIISIGADLSLFLGCVFTLIYVAIGFQLSSTWELVDWSTFPIFFGMVTSSYEGIGTIIPIESSMEGNRHNFSRFLHAAVLILTVILTIFGIIGYLGNGASTEQMLNKHIPSSDGTGMAINIFLCVGVILTFPLQIYPVIELTEIYILGKGSSCCRQSPEAGGVRDEDKISLLTKKDLTPTAASFSLPVLDEIKTWKRNVLRIIVVLLATGVALLMRDLFAYVNAFIGAIGCSLLAYVLPCLFHLKLSWPQLSCRVRVKDICIIVFGIVASVVSLYTTIMEVIKKV